MFGLQSSSRNITVNREDGSHTRAPLWVSPAMQRRAARTQRLTAKLNRLIAARSKLAKPVRGTGIRATVRNISFSMTDAACSAVAYMAGKAAMQHLARARHSAAAEAGFAGWRRAPARKAVAGADGSLDALRCALYADTEVVVATASREARLAAHLMNATLMLVMLPVGTALMIYSLIRGGDPRLSAGAMVAVGTVMVVAHSLLNPALLAGLV